MRVAGELSAVGHVSRLLLLQGVSAFVRTLPPNYMEPHRNSMWKGWEGRPHPKEEEKKRLDLSRASASNTLAATDSSCRPICVPGNAAVLGGSSALRRCLSCDRRKGALEAKKACFKPRGELWLWCRYSEAVFSSTQKRLHCAWFDCLYMNPSSSQWYFTLLKLAVLGGLFPTSINTIWGEFGRVRSSYNSPRNMRLWGCQDLWTVFGECPVTWVGLKMKRSEGLRRF